MTHPVSTQWLDLPEAGSAYLALPPGGRGPGLLLLQEIFGVNAHVRAVAEQYALAGFVVLAPDVFWRGAPRIELGYEGDDRQRGIALAGTLKPETLIPDLQAWVAALRRRTEVDGHKVGAIGYCLGGRLAYLAAAQTGVDAAVAYYGGGIHNQLALVPQINCPMLFHYAGQDDNIPLAAVQAVREAFADMPAQVLEYPGTHHGFNCWARSSYNPPAAALALGRSLQFLAEELF